MGGICGIVLERDKGKVGKACLKSMISPLGIQDNYAELIIESDGIGFGSKGFPGRLAGICKQKEHGRNHAFAFHGRVFNVEEIFGDGSSEERLLQQMMCFSLNDIKKFLLQLRGEFSFALWNGQEETLFLACDRLRVSPLFYFQAKHVFAFASRMQSILKSPWADNLTVDSTSIVEVVSQSFISTPKTIFREIKKLPPGSFLTWKKGESQIEPYWDCCFLNPLPPNRSQLTIDLQDRFSDSIKVRLRHSNSRGNFGSFLSGGIDSSTVLGVLSRLKTESIKSFSIGFSEQPFNELEFARHAAQVFHSEHHEYIVTPKVAYDVLPDVIASFDEPFGNASAIPTYCCAKLAKEKGVQILFAGDGGDELFAGNERYAMQKVFDYYALFPQWLRAQCIEPTVSSLANILNWKILHKGLKYIRRANIPYPDRLFSWGLFSVMPMGQIFTTEFIETCGLDYDPYGHIRLLYNQAQAVTELDRQLYIDLKLAIVDNDLFKVTRMTEANGLSVHFPFLDHRLVEFALCVPSCLKMQGRELRTFFKQAYSDLLPPKVIKKVKHGFGLPIPIWLRTDKNLREMMMDLLTGQRLTQRGYFPQKTIQNLLDHHMGDDSSFFGTILWNVVVLELWLQRFYDTH